MTVGDSRDTVGHMAHEPSTTKPENAWSFFYLPLIVGLAIGAASASATDQWWWATVGAVLGAAAGEIARRLGARRRAR